MGNMENKFDELKGDAKERVGDATDNRDLQGEGLADQAGAKLKQAAEHAKDAVGDIKKKATD